MSKIAEELNEDSFTTCNVDILVGAGASDFNRIKSTSSLNKY
ncbi:hypothetical protein [Adhaeribacter aquaticus]|nr:hypothetical protein [Adhaeribacter aquaticus]